eukprot:3422907-Prymnesium_polylepis.1
MAKLTEDAGGKPHVTMMIGDAPSTQQGGPTEPDPDGYHCLCLNTIKNIPKRATPGQIKFINDAREYIAKTACTACTAPAAAAAAALVQAGSNSSPGQA